MAECLALAREVAGWGGAVVPARVTYADGGWHKGSIRGWPARASSDPGAWPEEWFTWGGNWWAALCPRTAGLVALDLDGEEAVALLREAVALMQVPWDDSDPPLAYRTPGHGGGMHFVWRWPPGLASFSRRVVTLASGAQVDLRGEGTFLLLCGAPRPDLPEGARRYSLVARPGEGGPPPLPDAFLQWMDSLGVVNIEGAPSLGAKQLSPAGLASLAAAQGGRIKSDRHVALFRAASYLRVRQGTRTFETLAAALWGLVEAHFDIDGEQDHWEQETLRIARNASRYTEERDRRQEEAAASLAESWGVGRRSS